MLDEGQSAELAAHYFARYAFTYALLAQDLAALLSDPLRLPATNVEELASDPERAAWWAAITCAIFTAYGLYTTTPLFIDRTIDHE